MSEINRAKNIVNESSEFKPVLGNGVEADNKKNNSKAHTDAQQRAKQLNGGLKEKSRTLSPKDDNRTMLDYEFDQEPSKEYKERVKAQAEGYTSTLEKKNGYEKAGDFNDKIYNNGKEAFETMEKNKETIKKGGLVARTEPSSMFTKKSMYEDNSIKRVHFKHLKFMNEAHMMNYIPESFKVNGKKFLMRDSIDNEYSIIWERDDRINVSKGNIVKYTPGKNTVNEAVAKMQHLFNYKSVGTKTDPQSRINEETSVKKSLDILRNKLKKD